MDRKTHHDITRNLRKLNYAKRTGNIAKACRYFGMCRETFYTWKRAFKAHGEESLINNKPSPENHKLRIPKVIEEKIIYLRTRYHFGLDMFLWHMQRYYNIKISRNGCYQVLLRNKLNLIFPTFTIFFANDD